jgi:hypothetical protein
MPSTLKDELEAFEADLNKDDDDGMNVEEEAKVDETPTEEVVEEKADETSQEAETATEEPSVETEEAAEETSQEAEEPEAKPEITTTLPDDSETFGELAGQKVTAQQLIEAGLFDKLVTWGHQGRHMVKKGQEEISEAKALRELLEKQFEKQDKAAEQAAQPKLTEEQFAKQVTEHHLPALQKLAEVGAIETDFVKEFPRVASQIENRFQSGSELLQALIKEVSELREYVGGRKEVESEQAATGRFENLTDGLAKKGELFEKLADDDMKVEFATWIAAEETGLKIADKDLADVTEADLQSAWLLYVHNHPEAMKPKKETVNKETNSHLAGGGGGRASSKSKSPAPADELATFEAEFQEAIEADREY